MLKTLPETPPPSSSVLNAGLWLAQALVSLTLVGGALWKFLTPIPILSAQMPWMGQVSPTFLYATALLDFLGGLGVLLPSATRIYPQLTVIAALCCALLMTGAVLFHFSRGEAAATPFNFAMAGLAVFVAWGRRKR